VLASNRFFLLDRNGLIHSQVQLDNRVFSNWVRALLITPAGELLMSFSPWSGSVLGLPPIVRIQSDGTADATFNPEIPPGVVILAAVSDANGKIYVAINPLASPDWTLLRLHSDGSRDATLRPLRAPGWGERVDRLSLIDEGKIEILSSTCFYRGCNFYRLLFENGSILPKESYSGYSPPKFQSEFYARPNGEKIVVAYNSYSSGLLYRRNADGTIDPSLKTGSFDGQLTYIGTQSNGNIIAYDESVLPARLLRIGPGTTLQTNLVKVGNPSRWQQATASEAKPQVEVELFRLGDSSKPISVWLKTEDGTAQAGVDYTPLGESVTFEPYETVKRIPIRILQDALTEEEEHFFARISEPAVGTMVIDSSTIVSLLDDDYIRLYLYRTGDGRLNLSAENRTQQKIELQFSDDGARTWHQLTEADFSPYITINAEAEHHMYRAILHHPSPAAPGESAR